MTINPSELFNRTKNSPPSSDSEQELDNRQNISMGFSSLTTKEKRELDAILAKINKKLANGEEVDLSEYPPLFVVHYRGCHFFKTFFTPKERQETRRKIIDNTLREGCYSPAVYESAGLKLGSSCTTDLEKKKMDVAIRELRERFETLSKEPPKSPGYSKVLKHERLIFSHYNRYVNSYEEFREESRKQEHKAYRTLECTTNPYVSTADHPRHAVLYALGAKAELKHGTLRPGYDETLKPKHPKAGYVQIFFHTLTSLKRNAPLPLSTLHASRKIAINDRLLNERETTHKAAIAAKHVVAKQIVRFPALNVSYTDGFHDAKYGLTNRQSYSRIKNSIKNKAERSTFISSLADHYAELLSQKALEIARKKKGFIVYLGLDGTLQRELPTTMDVRNKDEGLYDEYQTNLSLFTTTANESDSFDEFEITTENVKKAKKVTKSKPKSKAELLKKEAANQGFELHNVEGDGDCFYHALAHQLKLERDLDRTAEKIKQACRSRIESNKRFYQKFETEEVTIDDLLTNDNEWADHIMIQAAANVYKIVINIVRSDGAANTVIRPSNVEPVATVNLGYEVGLHYQSLVKVKDLADDLEKLDLDD